MLEKPKIVIIDDSNDTLDLLELFLYPQYDIITAQNGFEGLSLTQQHTPICILTDITMPVMDGIKFINTLKKNSAIAHIPIIAITSFIQQLNSKSLLNIGFTDVISKPFNKIEVLQAVNRIIENRKSNENDAIKN